MSSVEPIFIFVLLSWADKYNCLWSQAAGPSVDHSPIKNHTPGPFPTVDYIPIGLPAHSPGPQKTVPVHGTCHLGTRPLGILDVSTVWCISHPSRVARARSADPRLAAWHPKIANHTIAPALGPLYFRERNMYVFSLLFPPFPSNFTVF